MTNVWIVTRNLTDEMADKLDITNLTAENDNNFFEAIKIKIGFKKIGINAKIVTMGELGSELVIAKTPKNKLPDIVVIRCMLHHMGEVNTINALCNHNIIVMNNPKSQTLCIDKWGQYRQLKAFGVSIPTTTAVPIYATSEEINTAIIREKLSFPIVVKSNCGSRSDTVFKCNSVDEILECAQKINIIYPFSKIMILQEWINHNPKGVISVLTLGDKIVAAQQRTANKKIDFFISNYRKDCNRCAYEITNKLRRLVLEAIKVIGNIEMSRLDVLYDGQNYLICEINSPGAFTAFNNFMGIDCGLMIAEYALERYKKDNKLI